MLEHLEIQMGIIVAKAQEQLGEMTKGVLPLPTGHTSAALEADAFPFTAFPGVAVEWERARIWVKNSASEDIRYASFDRRGLKDRRFNMAVKILEAASKGKAGVSPDDFDSMPGDLRRHMPEALAGWFFYDASNKLWKTKARDIRIGARPKSAGSATGA